MHAALRKEHAQLLRAGSGTRELGGGGWLRREDLRVLKE
jgi:hypothetical protein